MMDASAEKEVNEFTDSLNELYSQIREFLDGTDLKITETKINVTEERSGTYKAPLLTIRSAKENREIAKIIPAGTWFIASKGIVDIKGKLGSESLVLMDKGGPSITTQITVGKKAEAPRTAFLYKGIEKAGWYWIENKKQRTAKLLNKELLFALISSVSDYEFNS